MPLPEDYLPRENDELLIRATVKYAVDPGDTDVHLSPVGAEYRVFAIPLADVFALHCRSWQVGDKVHSISDRKDIGNVIAVHAVQVWVKTASGAMATFYANALELHPEDPKAVPTTEQGEKL